VAPPREVAGPNPANPLQAKEELLEAWQGTGKKSYEDGLVFGKVCLKWQKEFRAQGSRQGLGLRAILHEVGIPVRTAYWWIDRYKERNKAPKTREAVEPKEISLEEALDKFVKKIVMQPYGAYAAKFAAYDFQHPTELAVVEEAKREVYRLIGEICQTKKTCS
jgi:hypothetical protein